MSFLENIASNMKMPIGETLLVSLIGLLTVVIVLAFIACLIILISKAIRTIETTANKNKPVAETADSAAVPVAVPMPEGMNQGELELIETDEKTAAVIMAIVSDKSGIPLNRLSFKSIRLMEDEK